ncbi:MAG: YbjN domain-containing protein [Candidatus Eremiobacteraeota bacterium]|nr:YbjN domain-containing protein [Candidatus Eremiobacteraeota bacterium]
MKFDSPAQEECYKKILPWMQEMFGEFVGKRVEVPEFGVRVGSAFAQTAIYPMGEDDAVISTRAYVVTGAELTADLMHFLLRENDRMTFGAFGVDEDGDIFFEHTIVGSTCDQPELKTSVSSVVLIADEYDDLIAEKWGGQRAIDRLRSEEEEESVTLS